MCESGILPCAGGGRRKKKRRLIAFALVRPQMLVVDSRRETADDWLQAGVGGGRGILTNSESSVHIVSRP